MKHMLVCADFQMVQTRMHCAMSVTHSNTSIFHLASQREWIYVYVCEQERERAKWQKKNFKSLKSGRIRVKKVAVKMLRPRKSNWAASERRQKKIEFYRYENESVACTFAFENGLCECVPKRSMCKYGLMDLNMKGKREKKNAYTRTHMQNGRERGGNKNKDVSEAKHKKG